MIEEDLYENQSDCQDYEDYGQEGYHPVALGQRFNDKYKVIQKLGWGHFSTVWLVHNQQNNTYSALKIQKSKQNHAQTAIDQLNMLTTIRKHQNDQQWLKFIAEIVMKHPLHLNVKLCRPLSLLDNFTHYGIHGKHYCSVFQLMGPNLLDLIQHFEYKQKRMPIWLVKKITIDVLMGLVHLHDYSKLIHTDLKPQNIMMKLHPQQEIQLIESIKKYKVKPLSMKFLKNLQASKNSKNKKKNEKKKLKKKKQKEGVEGQKQINAEESEQIKKQSEQTTKKQQNIVEEKNDQHEKVQTQLDTNKQQNISDMSILKWKNVNIKLNTDVFFKIADMGNACHIDKHWTDDIQTRQYRAPQIIVGHEYFPNTDIFSLACTVFQMLTNSFLFKPKRISGISKNQDHLYKMIEVLGPMPKQFAAGGKYSNQLFNKKGKLLHGHPKQQVPLSTLLIQDYGYQKEIAQQAEKFLLPMLVYQPSNRISAFDCLKSQWLWN